MTTLMSFMFLLSNSLPFPNLVNLVNPVQSSSYENQSWCSSHLGTRPVTSITSTTSKR